MLSGIIVLSKLLLSVKWKEWVGVFPCIRCNVMYTESMVFEPFFAEVGYRLNRFGDSRTTRFCSLCLDQGLELGIFLSFISQEECFSSAVR